MKKQLLLFMIFSWQLHISSNAITSVEDILRVEDTLREEYRPYSLKDLPNSDPRIVIYYLFHDQIRREQTKRDWWRPETITKSYDKVDFEDIGKYIDNPLEAYIINQCASMQLYFRATGGYCRIEGMNPKVMDIRYYSGKTFYTTACSFSGTEKSEKHSSLYAELTQQQLEKLEKGTRR